MRKLKLSLDALRVESFEVAVQQQGLRGTVRGAADTTLCPNDLEPPPPSDGTGIPCGSIMVCNTVPVTNCGDATPSCYYQVPVP